MMTMMIMACPKAALIMTSLSEQVSVSTTVKSTENVTNKAVLLRTTVSHTAGSATFACDFLLDDRATE